MTPYESGPHQYAPLRSKIGQYVHGNEPVHHVAYLYNYAGEPWKTQKWVSEVRNKMYGTGPDGLCGNDDMGPIPNKKWGNSPEAIPPSMTTLK
jgi:putative alpha-1,2-mannosidase